MKEVGEAGRIWQEEGNRQVERKGRPGKYGKGVQEEGGGKEARRSKRRRRAGKK